MIATTTRGRGKRGHNEGTIYKRGKKWQLELTVELPDGTKTQKKFGVYDTKTEAEQARIKLLAEQLAGRNIIPAKQTLADFAQDTIAKHLRLDQSTRERYAANIRLHVAPYRLGRTELSKVDSKMLADHYYRLQTEARIPKEGERETKPLSKRSAQYVHAILHRVLAQACAWRTIPANPAEFVDAPRPDSEEVRPLSASQRGALLRAAQGDPLEALYIVALGSGMRIGELLGLRWDDLDWQLGTLTVRQQAKRTKAGGLHLDQTKNDKIRVIPALPEVMAALQAHRDRQAFARAQAGDKWKDSGLVFPNGNGRIEEKSNIHRRHWKPLLERAGLPADVKFHTLRHTYATTCLQRGVSIKSVQAWLGHSTAKMLMEVYAHYVPAHGMAEIEKMRNYLSDSSAAVG